MLRAAAASDTLAAIETTIRSSQMPPAKRAATSAKTKTPAKKATASKTTKAAAGSGAAQSKSKASASPAAETTTAGNPAGAKRLASRSAPTKSAASKVATTKSAASKVAAANPAPKAAKPATTRTARTASPATARRSGTRAQIKRTDSARAAAARVKRAASTDTGVISIAEQLVKGTVTPKDVVMLTRERIQETLDDAASRGRMTRKDANELVAELVRRGRSGGDDIVSEIEGVLGKGRDQIESATKRAARSEPVDRIVRGADRARRAAGVGSSFPITGYGDLNVSQVQARLKELSKPELRKVLIYERNHANRKSVVGVIEKSL
jgi:polyhydroxyalkanoate synthesis regulator phasin